MVAADKGQTEDHEEGKEAADRCSKTAPLWVFLMQGFRILPLSHCLARKQLKKARAENTAPAASAGTAGRHRSASVASDHSSVADSASIAAGEGPSPLGGSSSTGIAIDFSAQPSARQRRPSLDSSHLSDVSGTTPPKAPVTLAAADAPPSAQPGPYAGSAEQARSRVKAMQQRSGPGGGRSRSALSSHRFVCVKPHEPQVVHSLRYEAPPRYKSASHVRRFESQPLPPQGSSGRCVALVPVLARACMLSGSSFNQPLPTVFLVQVTAQQYHWSAVWYSSTRLGWTRCGRQGGASQGSKVWRLLQHAF